MVNKSSLVAVLATLDGYIRELEELRRLPREKIIGDSTSQYAVRYLLQSAIQCLLDAGLHILVDSGLDRPGDNKDILLALGKHGVIASDFALRIQGMAGFRNILVHRYFKVDSIRVAQHLQDDVGDFASFAVAVRAWLVLQP